MSTTLPTNSNIQLKTIVDFARRKGFVFPSSEIYGGFAATYDFGPLGKLLKDNLTNAWRDFMVNYRTDTVEIEGAIFLHPKVWEASGHISGFSDLLVEDMETKKRYRADHLVEDYAKKCEEEFTDRYKTPKIPSNLTLLANKKVFLIDVYNHNIPMKKTGDWYWLPFWQNKFEALGAKTVDLRNNDIKTNVKILGSDYEIVTEDKVDGISESIIIFCNPGNNLILGIQQQSDSLDTYSSTRDYRNEFVNFEDGELLSNAGSFTPEQIDCAIQYYNLKSPDGNPLSKARKFNLLVKTHLGPLEDDSSLAYLKGEACQNIYVNWKQTQETTRRKIPFGVAQLGKAFRNEITVKQFMFRTREFEQIDMQYFVKPPTFVKKDEDGKNLEKDHFEWFAYWKDQRFRFYTEFLGYNPNHLKWHQHSPEELVFYAAEAWDIYYNFGGLGYKEMEGFHNRTDYDTRQHQKFSGTDLTYLDPETNERYLPYIVEMSLGVNRLFLSTMFEFYTEETLPSTANSELQEQIQGLEEIMETLKS